MRGYLGDEPATLATIDAGGWLHTGDLVRFDDDGKLFVVDRLKELIKVRGHHVAPAQLEAELMSHPRSAMPRWSRDEITIRASCRSPTSPCASPPRRKPSRRG